MTKIVVDDHAEALALAEGAAKKGKRRHIPPATGLMREARAARMGLSHGFIEGARLALGLAGVNRHDAAEVLEKIYTKVLDELMEGE